MIRKIAAAALLAAFLGGCSYSYDLIAVVRNGRTMIEVDPSSSRQPECVRQIEVRAEGESESAWRESVTYEEDCANKFPLSYGHRLRGQHQPESEEIAPKPLRHGIVYEVTATSGATGYGEGRFIVRADGRVENLPPQLSASEMGNGS